MISLPSHGLDHLCCLPAYGLRYRPARYGRRCCRRGSRRWLAVGARDVRNLYSRDLEEWLLRDRIPLGYGQFVGSPWVTVRRVPARLVEVTVVERREDHALPDPADTGLRLQASSRGLDAYYVALPYPERFRIRGVDLHPRIGGRVLELRRPRCLGAGVEVVDRASRVEAKGVLFVRLLVRWPVVCGLEEGSTVRSHRPVLGLRVGRAREQVLPVSLALFGSGVEISVGVEALGAFRMLFVARPLDARTAA